MFFYPEIPLPVSILCDSPIHFVPVARDMISMSCFRKRKRMQQYTRCSNTLNKMFGDISCIESKKTMQQYTRWSNTLYKMFGVSCIESKNELKKIIQIINNRKYKACPKKGVSEYTFGCLDQLDKLVISLTKKAL